jgi:dihydroorotate dehydrogenase electron transfer subunit
VVLSTDDGSLGFRGYVGSAMAAYHQANPVAADALVVYTCGPEPMMRFVAEYCVARQIECYVCVERNMACGTGMCQSCVVPVRDTCDRDGWSYRLCCTDGPIFEARDILWETPR